MYSPLGFSTLFARQLSTLLLFLAAAHSAEAQFSGLSRITSPNGRQVLEIRMGTMPANRNLVFTSVITAGPISGSTSLMLQQALARDIFNAAGPAPGWTVVRSSITAFSLGGGCGRNNLIDFPFINNNRPEILRITGTTQQVITLGITNSDQYDSIDCSVNGNGQVLYLLTNRTRQTLELRREQGGMLQLVRDNFGQVRSPFQGGMRPSIRFVRVPTAAALRGSPIFAGDFVFFMYKVFAEPLLISRGDAVDPDAFDTRSFCSFGSSPNTTGFGNVYESAAAGNAAASDFSNANRFDLSFYSQNGSTCTPGPVIPMSSRSGGTLYTFSGIAAVATESGVGPPGSGIASTTVIDTNTVATFVNGVRSDSTLPMAGRGGPKAACALRGSGSEGGTLIAGPGTANTQVQQSIVPLNLSPVIFMGDYEETWDSNFVRCDEN